MDITSVVSISLSPLFSSILDDILNDCSSGKSSPMCSLFYTEKTAIFEYPIPLSEYKLSNQRILFILYYYVLAIEKPVVKKVITRSFFDSSKPIIKPTEKPITVIQRVKRMMGLDKNSDRRVKYSYPIYINSMNDTNLDIPIFQYNPNWYEDYQKKMESIKADYTGYFDDSLIYKFIEKYLNIMKWD